MLDEYKAIMACKMGNVRGMACQKIIHANDFVPFGEKAVTKMRAEKASSTCDEYAHLIDPP